MPKRSDRRLFPDEPDEGIVAEDVVRGSAVLRELWWTFALAEYDKDGDGGACGNGHSCPNPTESPANRSDPHAASLRRANVRFRLNDARWGPHHPP